MSRPPPTYRLTASELHEVYVEKSQVQSAGLVVESTYEPLVPWVLGATTARTVRPGFYMHWAEEVFDREVRIRCNEEEDFYVFTFALEGHWQEISGARRRSYDRHSGTMALIRFSQSCEHRALATEQARRARHLTLAVEGGQLRQWLTERELAEHPQWRRFLNGEGEPCIVAPLSPRARLVVEQIQNCPFQGLCRTLSMEARCLDLIVEMIGFLDPVPGRSSRRLTSREQESINAAAEMLCKSLEAPPTLMELAARVALSESKLKAGFHQVFGTTTFGYLRQQRLEKARLLLERGDCSILDASHTVGISNPSHFAAMFKQHFGMNPKQFQMNVNRRK